MIAVPSLARRLLRSLLLPVLLAPATLPADTPEPAQRHLLWQVSGRSNLSREESVELDLQYTDNWRLVGDLGIDIRTVDAVARSRGAY